MILWIQYIIIMYTLQQSKQVNLVCFVDNAAEIGYNQVNRNLLIIGICRCLQIAEIACAPQGCIIPEKLRGDSSGGY